MGVPEESTLVVVGAPAPLNPACTRFKRALRGAYPDDEPISTCTLYQSKL